MRTTFVALCLGIVLLSASAAGQELIPTAELQVFDANGKFMGGLTSIDNTLRFRTPDGRTFLIPLLMSTDAVVTWIGGAVWFDGPDCTGNAYVLGDYAFTGLAAAAIAGDGQLYIGEPGDARQPVNRLSVKGGTGGECVVESGTTMLFPAEFYVDFTTIFEAPLSLAGGPPAPAMPSFGDVPPDHLFYEYIELLKAVGFTAGCGDGDFCPDAPVTRGQMAVFLVRALGLRWVQ